MSWRFKIRAKAETRWSQVGESGWSHQLGRDSWSWGAWVMSGFSLGGPSLSPQTFSPNPASLLSLGLPPALATLGSAHGGDCWD